MAAMMGDAVNPELEAEIAEEEKAIAKSELEKT